MQTTQPNLRYFLYARKSSEAEDRQVASVETQVGTLEAIARDEGAEIVEVLMEAQSAKAPGRPVFMALVERIRKGEAQGILCWKLDRLARNMIDGGQIIEMLGAGIIQHIRTYERSFYPSDNVLWMAIEFGMANQYIRDLSSNVKLHLTRKVREGWFPGVAPIGYRNNKEGLRGQHTIEPDPERFHLVRRLWDLMLTGHYSVPQLLPIAAELGLRTPPNRRHGAGPISRTTLYGIFTNPFYFGAFGYRGEVHPGKHQPMIAEEEFWRVQRLLGRKGVPRPKRHRDHTFIGLLHCGACGAAVTAEKHTKRIRGTGEFKTYTYYHCTKRKDPHCTQQSVTEEDIERQVEQQLSQIEIPQEFLTWAMCQLREMHADEIQTRSAMISAQRKAYDACVSKLQTLLDMRVAGEINEEEFRGKRKTLLQEKSRYQELLNDSDDRVTNWLNQAEEYLNFARDARKRYAEGNIHEKRTILAWIGLNRALIDQKLRVSLKRPLLHIGEAAPAACKISRGFEPPITPEKQERIAILYSQNPVLRAKLDDVRTALLTSGL